MSQDWEEGWAVLTVCRISRLEDGRVDIRSGTFLARLHAVLDEQAVGEGGIQLSVGRGDHVCGTLETRRGRNRQIKAWRVEEVRYRYAATRGED